jgi:hypothetical protein
MKFQFVAIAASLLYLTLLYSTVAFGQVSVHSIEHYHAGHVGAPRINVENGPQPPATTAPGREKYQGDRADNIAASTDQQQKSRRSSFEFYLGESKLDFKLEQLLFYSPVRTTPAQHDRIKAIFKSARAQRADKKLNSDTEKQLWAVFTEPQKQNFERWYKARLAEQKQ